MDAPVGTSSRGHAAVTILLSLLAIVIVTLKLSGIGLPLIGTDKGAVTLLFCVGFALCGLGPASLVARIEGKSRWPVRLPETVFGLIAIAVVLPAFTSVDVLMITDAGTAFVALAVVVAVKMVIATGYLIASRAGAAGSAA